MVLARAFGATLLAGCVASPYHHSPVCPNQLLRWCSSRASNGTACRRSLLYAYANNVRSILSQAVCLVASICRYTRRAPGGGGGGGGGRASRADGSARGPAGD